MEVEVATVDAEMLRFRSDTGETGDTGRCGSS